MPKIETSEPKLTVDENVQIRLIKSNYAPDVPGVTISEQRDYYERLWAAEKTTEANTTASALHESIAALLNFNNQTEELAEYHELEFGIGTTPDETGCSDPVGRIEITDPSNEGETFYMREFADEYELNPQPNADNTVPELSEMAAYSSDGDVYNYVTLTNTIKKTSDYVLIVNLSMSIGQ